MTKLTKLILRIRVHTSFSSQSNFCHPYLLERNQPLFCGYVRKANTHLQTLLSLRMTNSLQQNIFADKAVLCPVEPFFRDTRAGAGMSTRVGKSGHGHPVSTHALLGILSSSPSFLVERRVILSDLRRVETAVRTGTQRVNPPHWTKRRSHLETHMAVRLTLWSQMV